MSFIETDRLLLRTWMIPADVPDATALFADADVMRFAHDRLTAPEGITDLLRSFQRAQEQNGFGLWPVVSKATRSVIGDCGLGLIEGSRDVEISWHFKPENWGHGYATEAARAVLRFAFEEAHVQRVYALVYPDNARSIAVINRLGLRFDRVVRAYKRDLLRYAGEAPR